MTRAVAYASYLHLEELLACTQPVTASADVETRSAERFFIVCHQLCELEVAQVLADLDLARELARAGDLLRATPLVRRAGATMEVATACLDLLVHLPRERFAAFRPHLQDASGAESTAFRRLFRATFDTTGAIRELGILAAVYVTAPDAAGCTVDASALARALDEFVGDVRAWRLRHVDIARSFIGDAAGTGGTSGVPHLRERLGRGDEERDGLSTPAEPKLGEQARHV